MRHCTIVGFTVAGVSGVKPCANVNAGASAPEFDGDRRVDQLRQVQPELALAAVAIGLLIEDAEAAAHHHARRHAPRHADARREVVAIGMDQRAIEHAAVLRGEGPAGRRIDVGQQVVPSSSGVNIS